MITYVDTSTLIKLIVQEPGSELAAHIRETSDALTTARLIDVEARAALAGALIVGVDVLTSADTALCTAASAEGIAAADPLGGPSTAR